MAYLEEKIFEKAVMDFAKLKAYGFVEDKDGYLFQKTFMNGDFKAVVRISKEGKISGEVYDMASEDIYFPLRVDDMAVGFAGQVRAGYVEILEDIKAHCCKLNVFIGAQANRLMQKIFQVYGDEPDFPWGRFDTYGVFRNAENEKWYALIMNIAKNKLDKKLSGEIEVVNLKIDENKIPQLVTQEGFYPAYHMNKKNWVTVVLDDTLKDEVIFKLVDESHAFTLHKKRGKI